MAADAVNFRFNDLQAELTFRHQENFVLHKQTSEFSANQKAGSEPHNRKQ